MLAVVARGPIPIGLFEEFTILADDGRTHDGPPDERGHKDGWGILCFCGTEAVEYSRGPRSARGDGEFASAARSICDRSGALADDETLVVLSHIRRASEEAMRNREEFSHPFLESRRGVQWGFQHNGGLKGATFERIKTLDSLYLFDAILEGMRGGSSGDVERGYREAKARVLNRFGGYSSLTSILGNGDGVHCYREASTNPDYYTLTYDRRESLAIVCSEPIFGMSGRPLDQGEFLHIPAEGEWPR